MKALIITPYLNDLIRNICNIDEYNYVICADSAFLLCQKEMIVPNYIIGDFDHGPNVSLPNNNYQKVPQEKNDTDTMLCLKHCVTLGYDDITILGGIGGRFDHTFANIQTLLYGHNNNCNMKIITKNNEVYLPVDNKISIINSKKYFSIFSLTQESIVSIENAKYSGNDIKLTYDFPLGVSNEFINCSAMVTIDSGIVLIVLSNE